MMSPPHREPEGPSDAELMRQISEGRQEALAELYDRFASMLTGLAHRILGNREDAEEVLQEVLAHAWQKADQYRPERSAVSTWLVLITRSRAIDRLRTARVQARTLTAMQQENPLSHTSPEGARAVLSRERGQRVRQEMARLPDEQGQVLEMAFFGGMTQSEIAAVTGIPLGTVKTRTLLAMKKLRAALRSEVEELL